MRCDRLTLAIFRAAGSIFASRSAPQRARIHMRPPAGTTPRNREARGLAACSARRIVESRNTPRTASRNALDRHLTVYRFPLAHRTAPAAHLCPDRSTRARLTRSALPPPPHHKSASAAPPQTEKIPALSRPSPTHSTTAHPSS